MNVRFAEPCRENPLQFQGTEAEISERAINRPPCHECVQDIYLGIFFDGTNNNKFRDTNDFAHSNVARLYEAFIGSPAKQQEPALSPKVVGLDENGKPLKEDRQIFSDQKFRPDGFTDNEFQLYRKIYIPGVGTSFPEVGDSGKGADKKAGLAAGFLGEARLCWAMLQVCNQVHAAINGQPLRENLPFNAGTTWQQKYLPEKLKSCADEYKTRLDKQLKELEKELSEEVKRRGSNKPTIRSVRLSIFGFSRGAAAARRIQRPRRSEAPCHTSPFAEKRSASVAFRMIESRQEQ